MSPIQKLWLIDDDPLFRECAHIVLTQRNMAESIELISSGIEALGKLENNEVPDFIFIDINMPQMDGWQFLEAVAAKKLIDTNQTLIYMLSSSVDTRDVHRAKQLPLVAGFVSKPLSHDTIVKLIAEIKQ